MLHLVTGGSGFLGNLIARRLLERGDRVRVLDIWEDSTRPKEIEFVNCDIRNREGVAKAMNGVEIVHHNVALVPLTKSGGKFWEVNVDGSRLAAEEAVKAGVPEYAAMVGDVMDAARAMFNDLLNKYDLRDAETYLPDLKRYLNNGGQGGQTPPGQGVGGSPEGSTGGAPGTPRLPIPSGPARIPAPASPGVAGSGAAARASAQVAGAG